MFSYINSELEIFENHNFMYIYEDYCSLKDNGIQINNLEFDNKNFVLDKKFIEECREMVNKERESHGLENLSSINDSYESIDIEFNNCSFSDFSVNAKLVRENIFIRNDIDDKNLKMNILKISDSKFKGKFYINKQYDGDSEKLEINNVIITDTVFEENFKLHNCDIDTVDINDCDFYRNADFFMSIFHKGVLEEDKSQKINSEDIGFRGLNFRGLALFGDTDFRKKFHLRYATLEGYSHFRNAKFSNGLDLDYANIQNEMNFFGVETLKKEPSKTNTSQETFRIIKHNFEKLGNKIESNIYHALELNQKRIKLEKEPFSALSEYLVFKLHDLSSEHSTNWFRVLLWIFFIGFISTIIVQEPILLVIVPILFILSLSFKGISFRLIYFNFCFLLLLSMGLNLEVSTFLTNIALITITNSSFVFIGFPDDKLSTFQGIILFLNKLSLGYLYYQFLISVRKDTRK